MHSVHVSKANRPFELVERKHIPEPNATQIRIKVQACGVCYSDTDETDVAMSRNVPLIGIPSPLF